MIQDSHATRTEIVSELLATYRQTTKVFMEAFQSVIKDTTECNAGAIFLLRMVRDCDRSSQHTIATKMNVSDAAISRQVAICLEKNYIQSCVDTSNRRKAIISLTKEGEQVLEAVDAAVNKYVAERLRSIPDAELRRIINDTAMLQQRIQL